MIRQSVASRICGYPPFYIDERCKKGFDRAAFCGTECFPPYCRMARINLLNDSVVVAVRDQIFCDVGKESVILHLQSGIYYGLNAIGTRIWQCLQQPCTVSEILSVLLLHYEVDTEQCSRDLLRLLDQLREVKLIDVLPTPDR